MYPAPLFEVTGLPAGPPGPAWPVIILPVIMRPIDDGGPLHSAQHDEHNFLYTYRNGPIDEGGAPPVWPG